MLYLIYSLTQVFKFYILFIFNPQAFDQLTLFSLFLIVWETEVAVYVKKLFNGYSVKYWET